MKRNVIIIFKKETTLYFNKEGLAGDPLFVPKNKVAVLKYDDEKSLIYIEVFQLCLVISHEEISDLFIKKQIEVYESGKISRTGYIEGGGGHA